MRKLSRILEIAMLVMAAIIIPLGPCTVIMAFELGLILDGLSCALRMCLFIAFSLYEFHEIIAEDEWHFIKASVEETSECDES